MVLFVGRKSRSRVFASKRQSLAPNHRLGVEGPAVAIREFRDVNLSQKLESNPLATSTASVARKR